MWRLVVLLGVIAIAVGLAVAGGFGSDDLPLSPADPRRAEVVCATDGAVVRDERVLPLRGGVHLVVENPSGADRLEIRSATDELLGEVSVALEGPTEATLAIPPGPVTLTCSADGESIAGADVMTVVDPDDRWISPELACDDELGGPVELVTALVETERAQSTARRAVPGLRGSDELDAPGYPGSRWHGDLLIVRRDGEAVARITRAQDGGAWHVFVESCPGVDLVS